MEKYNPYKLTALKIKALSVPMMELMNLYLFNPTETILDYGCGNGDDLKFN